MAGAVPFLLTAEVTGLLTVAVILVATLGLGFRSYLRHRPSQAELEFGRRQGVNSWGKMGDGLVIEVQDNTIVYSYHVRGVGYTASQDVSALQSFLPEDRWSVVGPVSVKYDPRNPANSIVLCEGWNGFRKLR